jgi:hypothetical protein
VVWNYQTKLGAIFFEAAVIAAKHFRKIATSRQKKIAKNL